jgi:hypothetical protein
MAEGSDLSAIFIYTQAFTSRLKAERRNKKSTCRGDNPALTAMSAYPEERKQFLEEHDKRILSKTPEGLAVFKADTIPVHFLFVPFLSRQATNDKSQSR